MLLILSFEDTIATDVGRHLGADLRLVIASSDKGIDRAINYIAEQKPARVLALGMYAGKDSAQCRLELSCSSRFRNQGTRKKWRLNSWLNSMTLKPANGMGNSWCNKLSYEVTRKYSQLPFSFVHIPKSYEVDKAVEEIQCAAVSS